MSQQNHQNRDNRGINMKRVSDEPPALIFREESDGRKVSRWGGRDVLVNSIQFNPAVGVQYRCHVYDLRVGKHFFYVAEPTEETCKALAQASDPAWCNGTVIAVLCPCVRRDGKNVEAVHPVTGKRVRFLPGRRVWVDVAQDYILEEDQDSRKVTALPLHEPPANALSQPDPNNPEANWAFLVPEDIEAVLLSFKPNRKGDGVIAFHRRYDGKPIFPAWGATVPIKRAVKVTLIEQDRRVIAKPMESVKELKVKYPNAEFHTAERPKRHNRRERRGRRQDGRKPGNKNGRGNQGEPRQDECPKSQVDKFRERHGEGALQAEKPTTPPLPEAPEPATGHRPQSLAEQLGQVQLTQEEE